MVTSKLSTFIVTVTVVALAIAAPSIAAPSNPGCGAGTSPYPCLPGIDSIGIGYDIVRGASFGVGSKVVQLAYDPTNTWKDPFSNNTYFAYPNDATFTLGTEQFTGHQVYRSVSELVEQRISDVHAHAGFAGFFSMNTEVLLANSRMRDGMYIEALSEALETVYSVTLAPSSVLTPEPTFQKVVDMLPDTNTGGYQHYYDEFIESYGTHFVKAAQFGGRARMKTVISQDYFSRNSDAEIKVNLAVAWGIFGGGAGGGTSKKSFSADWESNAVSTTLFEGGDPAINNFTTSAQWSSWVKSVERGSPAVVQLAVDPIWYLIRNATKAALVQESVLAYAARHNKTWHAADPASYTMGWCDCYAYRATFGTEESLFPSTNGHCRGRQNYDAHCKPGFFMTHLQNDVYDSQFDDCSQDPGTNCGTVCCRPCFTVQQ